MPRRYRSTRRHTLYGQGAYKVGRPYVRGRGAYSISSLKPYTKGWASRAGTYIGGIGGAALGNAIAPGIGGAVGGAAGGYVGRKAGQMFSKMTGWGAYKVHSNSILMPDKVVPSFGEDSIRVKKRECIGHINATTAFQNNSFPINPGLSDTFPWLSQIANNYEQYRINGMVFQFKSTCSDAIASTTNLGLGQVILATDYNAQNAPYVNDLQMLGATFSNSDKPSRDILHAVECAPTDTAQKLYYVRSGDVPSGADARLYDMGTFQIATVDMGANYTGMGQLWVTYDITFVKSVMNNQLGFDINTDMFQITGATNSIPFGTSYTEQAGSNLGMTIDSSNDQILFPPTIESGYYLIRYYWQGGAAAVAISFGYTNCTVMNTPSLSSVSNAGAAATASVLLYSHVVRIDARDAIVSVSSATLPTSVSAANILVTQLNGEIFV